MELKAYKDYWMDDVYDKDEVDAVIAEKDAEIARLKATLESEKASHYAESVDAGMRERRLKRALWLAKMSLSNTEAQEQVWKNVARKCRAKAEEYK